MSDTEFGDLINGQVSHSATIAGLRHDVAYWRSTSGNWQAAAEEANRRANAAADALQAVTTPKCPAGWIEVAAEMCGVDFEVHAHIDVDGDCDDWRVYPVGTAADIAHAIDEHSSLFAVLDRAVSAEVASWAADESHHAATVDVPSLREKGLL